MAVLPKALVRLVCQTHYSWNRTWDWLIEVENLRLSLPRGPKEPLEGSRGSIDT